MSKGSRYLKEVFIALKHIFCVVLFFLTIPFCSGDASFPKDIITKSAFFEANGKGEARVHIQIIPPNSLPYFVATSPEQFDKHSDRNDFEIYISDPTSLRGKGSLQDIIDNLTFVPCKHEKLDLRYKFSFLRGDEVVLEFYADKSGNIYIPFYGKPLSVKEPNWLARIFKSICLDISPGGLV